MPTNRLCPSCGDQRLFDCPPCLDGHGAECPEQACMECGAALLLDPLSVPAPVEAVLTGAILSSAA
jgi:hypothetical protein